MSMWIDLLNYSCSCSCSLFLVLFNFHLLGRQEFPPLSDYISPCCAPCHEVLQAVCSLVERSEHFARF